jgi:hypothetical protein
VVNEHGAPAEANNDPRPTGEQKAKYAQGNCRELLKSVEPDELRVGFKIANRIQIRYIVLACKDPGDVAVEET